MLTGLDGVSRSVYDERDVNRVRSDTFFLTRFARVHPTRDEVWICVCICIFVCTNHTQAYTALVDCIKWRKEFGVNDLKGEHSYYFNSSRLLCIESMLNPLLLKTGEFYFHGTDRVRKFVASSGLR